MAQLFLFEESREEKMLREFEAMKEKIEKLRKSQYAKITTLESQVRSLIEQLEFLQSNIARKGYYL